jgi:hypothetical protein
MFSFEQRATAEVAEKELIALLCVNKNEWHAGGKDVAQVHAGDPRILRGVVPRSFGTTFTW